MKTTFLCFVILIGFTQLQATKQIYAKAKIESCPGCSLNRLPEVRAFIYEDVPKYEGVEFKKIHGAPPELVLFDDADEEVERLPLRELSRMDCNDLLLSKGFNLKDNEKLEL